MDSGDQKIVINNDSSDLVLYYKYKLKYILIDPWAKIVTRLVNKSVFLALILYNDKYCQTEGREILMKILYFLGYFFYVNKNLVLLLHNLFHLKFMQNILY